MREHIRLEALEALDAIDRYGSFAAAAASLYRVPSAISYTINQLEAELAIAVFDRRGHRATLTPAGRLLLDEGRRILLATRELGAAAQRLANHWEPELRLAIDALIAPAQLWPAMAAFGQAHPEINMRLAEEVLGGTWESLIDERVDLAIGVADPPATSGVERVGHIDVAFVFCCAPTHPLAAHKTPLTSDDLRAHRAIVVADSARHFSPRRIAGALLDGQPRLTVSTMPSKVDALEAGLGVGFCPQVWVTPSLAAGRLVSPPLADPRPPQRADILCRGGERGRALQWFIDYLNDCPPPRDDLASPQPIS
ncbi:MAG: LysR substrate-binding domain-containing protein [Salinisphaera sp.]|jgi:DNA-binding transcriptional LysR family regulator|nr:LysR substrate-binding domain-containing protein [Salinisphaera sp.]